VEPRQLDHRGAHGGDWFCRVGRDSPNLSAKTSDRFIEENRFMDIVNFGILKHPLNWVIVILMVLIFGIAVHLVLDFYGISSGKQA
jgi:hypothetical protein